MKNKLIRLAELVQEDFPEDLLGAFRSHEQASLERRIAVASAAIDFHQRRSAQLWQDAGRKRTQAERGAAARAELAALLLACLTGGAGEYRDSAQEALRTLGRQAELDLVKSLAGR